MASVWWDLTATRTQSALSSTSLGSVMTSAGARAGIDADSMTYSSNGRRAHATTSRPAAARWAAKKAPTEPGPTTATSAITGR